MLLFPTEAHGGSLSDSRLNNEISACYVFFYCVCSLDPLQPVGTNILGKLILGTLVRFLLLFLYLLFPRYTWKHILIMILLMTHTSLAENWACLFKRETYSMWSVRKIQTGGRPTEMEMKTISLWQALSRVKCSMIENLDLQRFWSILRDQRF